MKARNISIVILIFISVNLFGQNTGAAKRSLSIFMRKNITIVPLNLTANKDLSPDLMEASRSIKSDNIIDIDFVSANALNEAQLLFSKSIINLKNGLEKDYLPVLEKLLRDSKILNEVVASACNQDSVSARVNRTTGSSGSVVTKPSIAELTVKLDNTYILMPIIISTEKKLNDGISTGYYCWFKLDASMVKTWDQATNMPSVDEIILTNFVKTDGTEKVTYFNPDDSNAKLFADYNDETQQELIKDSEIRAGRKFVKNITIAFAGNSRIKAQGMIKDVSDGYGFNLGKKENLHYDQELVVYDWELNKEGKPELKYVGFGRVYEIANNISSSASLSKLKVTKGSFEAGQIIVPHDQLFDIELGASQKSLTMPKEFGNFLYIPFTEDLTKIFSIKGNIKYNLGWLIKIPQLFVGVEAGWGSASVNVVNNSNSSDASGKLKTTDFFFFLQKKFWLGPFALMLQGEYGGTGLTFTSTYSSQSSQSVEISGTGFGFSGGIQYALSPDFIVGISGGIRSISKPDKATVTSSWGPYDYTKDKNSKLWENEHMDSVDLSGTHFEFTISYSIPNFF